MTTNMRAVGVNAFGGPDVLEVLELPVPEPGEGEALVELEFAGINFIDIYMRSGHYAKSDTYKTPLPMVLGMEGAGRVAKAGAGVSNVAEGDRVAWCIIRGAYAEQAVVPAWKLVKVPDDVPLDIAAALQLQGCTAHYLTHSAYTLKEGDVCLAHAGAGGVGQLLIQLAKMRGATVIVTVGSPEKAEIAKSRGADHTILYRDENFRDRVMEITEGRGVNVVYDAVGKDTIHDSIRSLAKRGLCVNYGGASGLVQSIEPLELAEAGSVFFTRPHLADYMRDADEISGRVDDLFGAYRDGKLKVTIDTVFPSGRGRARAPDHRRARHARQAASGHPPVTAMSRSAPLLAAVVTMFATYAMVILASMVLPVLAPIASGTLDIPARYIGLYAAVLYAAAACSSMIAPSLVVKIRRLAHEPAHLLFAAAGLFVLASGSIWGAVVSAILIGFAYGPGQHGERPSAYTDDGRGPALGDLFDQADQCSRRAAPSAASFCPRWRFSLDGKVRQRQRAHCVSCWRSSFSRGVPGWTTPATPNSRSGRKACSAHSRPSGRDRD